jgi:hypothetical protein
LIENNPVYKPYAKCLNINKNNQVAFTKTVTTNSVHTYHEQGAVSYYLNDQKQLNRD